MSEGAPPARNLNQSPVEHGRNKKEPMELQQKCVDHLIKCDFYIQYLFALQKRCNAKFFPLCTVLTEWWVQVDLFSHLVCLGLC